MASTFSTNKRYQLPATGDQNGTWGVTINSNLSTIDLNIGGKLNVPFTNADVSLTIAQQEYLAFNCTGILTGNVNLIFLATAGGYTNGGLFIITNSTTGTFTLSAKVAGGTANGVTRGSTTMFYSNGTQLIPVQDVNFMGRTLATSGAIVNQILLQGGKTGNGCLIQPGGASADASVNMAIGALGASSTLSLGVGTASNVSADIELDHTNNWMAFHTDNNAGNLTKLFISSQSTGANAAACVLSILKDAGTNRSINAAGTIGASGADYAEYEHKSAGCPDIAAGDICGFDKEGLLTTAFSAVVSRFAIKSTTPNLVGGDAWDSDPRPAFDPRVDAEGNRTETEEAFHDRLLVFREETMPQWQAAHEVRRGNVDRIAYCGKTPCNLSAGPGDVGKYLVPAAGSGDTITATLVEAKGLTLPQLISSIGIIHSIGEDGRPIIAVGVR